MTDQGQDMLAYLGVAPDARLLDADLGQLPAAEQRLEAPVSTREHERLVLAGSAMTAASLLGGLALLGIGAEQLLFAGGGALMAVLGVVGLLLVATHWGWVHLAEYAGLQIDARQTRELEARRHAWLAGIEPYPRFSVVTSVTDDGAMHVRRLRHRPVLTERMRELWEAAATSYAAALLDARDDAQQLAARRAAAVALSQHINASLLDAPVTE